ncbi:MAG: restriction endonuclease [Acidimicrobiales bacterium]
MTRRRSRRLTGSQQFAVGVAIFLMLALGSHVMALLFVSVTTFVGMSIVYVKLRRVRRQRLKRRQQTELAERDARGREIEAQENLERERRVAVTRGPRPEPTLIRSYRDAEKVAAAWMRWLGWGDAQVTALGPDGGVDVIATRAVAQVKAHVNPIGRPEIQKLYGVAQHQGRTPLFFASAGFTRDAQDWANDVKMALFRFDLSGEPEPMNETAAELWKYALVDPTDT